MLYVNNLEEQRATIRWCVLEWGSMYLVALAVGVNVAASMNWPRWGRA